MTDLDIQISFSNEFQLVKICLTTVFVALLAICGLDRATLQGTLYTRYPTYLIVHIPHLLCTVMFHTTSLQS